MNFVQVLKFMFNPEYIHEVPKILNFNVTICNFNFVINVSLYGLYAHNINTDNVTPTH